MRIMYFFYAKCTIDKLRFAATEQIMEDYICVSLDGVEVLELDCEDDGSYHLSSLSALIGCEAAGLRYKNERTGNFRGVKVTTDGELLPPRGGWGSRIYSVVVKDSTGSYSSCETSLSQPGDDSELSQPVPQPSMSLKGANHASPQPQPLTMESNVC